MTPIATDTVFIRLGERAPKELTITLHCPEKDPKSGSDSSTMRCLVEIDGVDRSAYIYGESSLQALVLAHVYLRVELECLQRDGYAFYESKEDQEPYDYIGCLFTKIE